MKLLLVEDDREGAAYLSRALQEAGHSVDIAADGSQGLRQALADAYDLIILDRLLPALDGIAVLRALRSATSRVPVLLLTAVDGIADRVEGLDAGADDYLVKPFAFVELQARMHALIRRLRPPEAVGLLYIADLQMDLIKREVHRQQTRIDLQPREFQILEFLMRRAGQVVTRAMMLEGIWGYDFDPRTNIIDTHVSRLRAKVNRGFRIELIRTVRGAGYTLVDDG